MGEPTSFRGDRTSSTSSTPGPLHLPLYAGHRPRFTPWYLQGHLREPRRAGGILTVHSPRSEGLRAHVGGSQGSRQGVHPHPDGNPCPVPSVPRLAQRSTRPPSTPWGGTGTGGGSTSTRRPTTGTTAARWSSYVARATTGTGRAGSRRTGTRRARQTETTTFRRCRGSGAGPQRGPGVPVARGSCVRTRGCAATCCSRRASAWSRTARSSTRRTCTTSSRPG